VLTVLGVIAVAVGVIWLVLIIIWLVQGLRTFVLVGHVFGTLGCLLAGAGLLLQARDRRRRDSTSES